MAATDLNEVFFSLKAMMAKHAMGRLVVHDTDAHYYLNEGTLDTKG